MPAARRLVLLVVSDDNGLVRQVAKMTSEFCELIVARSSFRVTAILNAGQSIGAILVARTADRAGIERLALENPNAQKHIAGQAVKKVIVVPGRLVNIVV